MNTGQMLITLAALTLVVITTLNHNRTSITTEDNIIFSKEFILATSVAQSMLDEISGKAYDEAIVNGNSIFSAADFSSLQKDGTEAYPNFDDIDDYNGFSRVDSIPYMGVFTTSVKVEYVTDNLVPTVSKSYNKNVIVKVTSPNLYNTLTEKHDTLVMKSVYSQWKLL